MTNIDPTAFRGSSTEYYVAARLMEDGYEVFFPTIDQSRFDLLVKRGATFWRVQVKSAKHKVDRLQIKCNSRHHGKYDGYADVIMSYSPEENEFYAFQVTSDTPLYVLLSLNTHRNKWAASKHKYRGLYNDWSFQANAKRSTEDHNGNGRSRRHSRPQGRQRR